MLNLLGRFALVYFFVKLFVGASVFAYYQLSANYTLPWIMQIVLAVIIILLTIVCIWNSVGEGLIFAPVLYFVFLYFQSSGLKTFEPELREGFLNLLYPGQNAVSFENVLSVVCFSVVLYWNIKISKNKQAKIIGDQTVSVIVKRPRKIKKE